MGVTHIIRGDDHLTNAARQKQIYDGLGWDVPAMAHIPLIHGPDGAKLSKRHGALGVEAYRAMGYLPAALRNYLVRLGWSHGDQEIFSTEQMISSFDLGHVGRSPSRFDFAKLESLNAHYLRAMPDADLVAELEAFAPFRPDGREIGKRLATRREQLLAAIPGLKERAKTLNELVDGAAFILADRPLELDDKARALLNADARRILKLAATVLEPAEWRSDKLDAAIRTLAEREGVKLSAIAQPLRAALTGRATSPGIFEVMVVLGKQESLARIADQAGAVVTRA
jgi:glutamyl-tRNA synthetase